MSRTRRFLGGVAFGYANQALVTLVGLWLTTFLLLRLGQDDYGLWLVGTRILGYLMLLDLGVVALLPREVAFATGRAGEPTGFDGRGVQLCHSTAMPMVYVDDGRSQSSHRS